MSIEWVNARDLLTPDRIDYIVKHRFFRHLMADGSAGSEAEALYRWHIEKRTGGREPRSHKTSIQHYVDGCRDLMRSIEFHGFLKPCNVKIGTNGRIVGTGAHRIAACLAFGVNIAIQRVNRPATAPLWGADWFRHHGADEKTIEQLQETLWELSRMKTMAS